MSLRGKRLGLHKIDESALYHDGARVFVTAVYSDGNLEEHRFVPLFVRRDPKAQRSAAVEIPKLSWWRCCSCCCSRRKVAPPCRCPECKDDEAETSPILIDPNDAGEGPSERRQVASAAGAAHWELCIVQHVDSFGYSFSQTRRELCFELPSGFASVDRLYVRISHDSRHAGSLPTDRLVPVPLRPDPPGRDR
ncbi:Hypothetical protein UVM_LOCUS239 [uncultured virus]|nr:Hypothetical protein UVM_LOCUS239 [uncultured virus]